MSDCSVCGRSMGWADRANAKEFDGMCRACTDELRRKAAGKDVEISGKERAASAAEEKQRSTEIEAIMLTTETAPNLNIVKRIEVVTAECAFGMNIFKDLFAGVRDIVGGRSAAVQKTLRDSRRTALYELKREAYEVGANAVVGVDLDYVELSSAGSMVLLVASGTAVVIEDS